jgi:hypothetical protein
VLYAVVYHLKALNVIIFTFVNFKWAGIINIK